MAVAGAVLLATGTLVYRWADPLNSTTLDTAPARTTLESVVVPSGYDPNSLEPLFTLDPCPLWPDQSQPTEVWADENSLLCIVDDQRPDVETTENWTMLAVQLPGSEDHLPPFVRGLLDLPQSDGQGGLIDPSESQAGSEAYGQVVRHRCNDTMCAAWWTDENISVALASPHQDGETLQATLVDDLRSYVELTGEFDPAPHLPD